MAPAGNRLLARRDKIRGFVNSKIVGAVYDRAVIDRAYNLGIYNRPVLLPHRRFWPSLFQAVIYSLHKHVRGPWTGRGTETIVVIVRELGGFHLLERCTLVDHRLNAVADDHKHVAILGNLELIANTPVPRNDQGPAFLLVFVNGLFEDVVETIDLALQAAAVFQIDEGVLRGGEDVTGDDHVGAPEMHDTVSIGHRVRFPKGFNAFVVVILSSASLQEGIGGPAFRWSWSNLSGGRAHSVLNVLMRDDRRSSSDIAVRSCEERARQARIGAGRMELHVSARMFGPKIRIENELDRFVPDEFADRRNHFVG